MYRILLSVVHMCQFLTRDVLLSSPTPYALHSSFYVPVLAQFGVLAPHVTCATFLCKVLGGKTCGRKHCWEGRCREKTLEQTTHD